MGYRYQIVTSPLGVSKEFYEKWKCSLNFSSCVVNGWFYDVFPHAQIFGHLTSKTVLSSWQDLRDDLEIEVPKTFGGEYPEPDTDDRFYMVKIGDDADITRFFLEDNGWREDIICGEAFGN